MGYILAQAIQTAAGMSSAVLALLALLTFAIFPTTASSALSSDFPAPQAYRFGPLHHQPTVIDGDKMNLYLESSVENVWMYDPELFRIDAEVNQVLFQTSYRVHPNLELTAGVPFRYLSGGLLDRVIEDFHSVFGLGDANRRVADQEDLAVLIKDPSTGKQQVWIDQQERGPSLAEPVVEATFRIPHRPFDLAAHAFVRLPISWGPVNLSGYLPRTGLSLAAGKRLGPFYGSASGGLAYVSREEYMGVDLRRWVRSFAAALEYSPTGSRHTWFIQGMATDGAAREFASLSRGRYQVKLGYAYRFNAGTRFELGLLENVFRFDNTPDFGLHIGLTRSI
jgi:hypothetical protein